MVSPLQPVESGIGVLEAVRRIGRLPGTSNDFCELEERGQNVLTLIQELCLCGPVAGPSQFAILDLDFSGSCGTTVSTPGGPFLPGYMSQGIGSWTDPFTFPGVESLRWNCSGYSYGDPCVDIARNEVFFGVTTNGGWLAKQIPPAGAIGVGLPLIFIDQGNSLRGNLGTTMNKPYRSNHIININY